MKKHKLLLAILSVFACSLIFGQSSETIKNYIATYKDIAISEMQRTGVPASITLAQGIHETGAGTSPLCLKSNNHFGIKCKSEWKGESVSHDDDARGECFRKYNDAIESYRDHSDFLKYRPYYSGLFKLDPTDYEGWAYGLKKAGYATNPKYPQILIKLIEDYDLQQYTMIALNGKATEEVILAANNGNNEAVRDNTLSDQDIEDEEAVPALQNYPAGVFQINETRVILVKKGTSFLKVAEENKLSLARLFEFNDMKPADIAGHDQLVYLQRKRKTGVNEFHTVEKGETLHSIAQVEGIRIENLAEFNFLKLDMKPAIGEKLYLHAKAPAAPKLAVMEDRVALAHFPQQERLVGQSSPDDFILHTVQARETVYAIAKKYSVSIDDLMKWNNLQNISLRTGQQLRISKKNTNAN